MMLLNSIVVVGDQFSPSLVNPELVFSEKPTVGQSVILGPIAQHSYGGGICRFEVAPNRLDVKMQSEEVMPSRLVDAARFMAEALDAVRSAVTVTAIGMNCDGAVDRQEDDTGLDLCRSLTNMDGLGDLLGLGATVVVPHLAPKFRYEDMNFNIRIEPEVETEGRNIFVAVNGHQEVVEAEPIAPKIGHADIFRQYVEELHARLA